MARVTADFETGTNTNTIATSDTGSLNAFDVVSIGTSATATYDNTHAYGTLAAKLTVPVGSTTSFLQWSSASLGSITDAYGRLYLYRTANPATANAGSLILFRNTSTIRARLRITTGGLIELVNSANAVSFTSANAISLNQWVRLEWHYVFSATVGHMEAKLFNSPDSTSATETFGDQTTNLNLGGASANEFLVGFTATAASSTQWLDNIVWNDTSYPGPFATSTTSTLSASATSSVLSGLKTVGKPLTT